MKMNRDVTEELLMNGTTRVKLEGEVKPIAIMLMKGNEKMQLKNFVPRCRGGRIAIGVAEYRGGRVKVGWKRLRFKDTKKTLYIQDNKEFSMSNN